MNIDNTIFNKLKDVEDVLYQLDIRIKEKGYVTVFDYYEITKGKVSENDNYFGWTSLLDCKINICRYGYELCMSMPTIINCNSKTKDENYYYDDIIFTTRKDVEDILSEMSRLIKDYGYVTLGDMYDFAGLTAPYTANRYGWMGLRNIDIVRVRDGYILKLPKAMPIANAMYID